MQKLAFGEYRQFSEVEKQLHSVIVRTTWPQSIIRRQVNLSVDSIVK
jgi:hypothetical protein